MKIPAGQKISYEVTYLEMLKCPSFKSPSYNESKSVIVTERQQCSVEYFLSLYVKVGKKFEWTDQLLNGSEKVSAFLESDSVKFFELIIDKNLAGFFILDFRKPTVCDLSYFGLIEDFIGRGLGSYMLKYAILLAWESDIKSMSVNTNTLDHIAALPLYKKVGFKVIRVEKHTRILSTDRISDGRFSVAD